MDFIFTFSYIYIMDFNHISAALPFYPSLTSANPFPLPTPGTRILLIIHGLLDEFYSSMQGTSGSNSFNLI